MVMGMGLNGDPAVVLVQNDMEMYSIFHESPLCEMLARMMFGTSWMTPIGRSTSQSATSLRPKLA
ncbi:hypothetical protein GQ600_19719 [Phytophthora cactorum]|nr:hypothetical protein GQ600_19719 [Phytophthora cactorum]